MALTSYRAAPQAPHAIQFGTIDPVTGIPDAPVFGTTAFGLPGKLIESIETTIEQNENTIESSCGADYTTVDPELNNTVTFCENVVPVLMSFLGLGNSVADADGSITGTANQAIGFALPPLGAGAQCCPSPTSARLFYLAVFECAQNTCNGAPLTDVNGELLYDLKLFVFSNPLFATVPLGSGGDAFETWSMTFEGVNFDPTLFDGIFPGWDPAVSAGQVAGGAVRFLTNVTPPFGDLCDCSLVSSADTGAELIDVSGIAPLAKTASTTTTKAEPVAA